MFAPIDNFHECISKFSSVEASYEQSAVQHTAYKD